MENINYTYVFTSALMGFLNSAMSKYYDSFARRPYIKPMYDIYHSNFGTPMSKYHYAADFNIFVLACLWFTVCDVEDFNDCMRMYTAMYAIRLACVASTVGYVNPRKLKPDYHAGIGTNNRFTDMTVSGHMLSTCIIAFSIIDATDSFYMQVVASVLIAASVAINLLNGDHWTVDLVLGFALPYVAHYGI